MNKEVVEGDEREREVVAVVVVEVEEVLLEGKTSWMFFRAWIGKLLFLHKELLLLYC